MKNKSSIISHPGSGVFCSWFGGDYHFELISGIEHKAKLKGIRVIYFSGRTIHSRDPNDDNYNVIFDNALDAALDGLLIMPVVTNYCTG